MAFNSQRLQGNTRLTQVASNAPEMKIKEKGEAVRMVQQGLIDLGYPLPRTTKKYGTPDGIYGKETKAAVWKFQADKFLYTDGVVGTNTIGKMDDLLVGKPFTPLPPLGEVEEDDDSLGQTEDIILDTLGGGKLDGMTFSLYLDQVGWGHSEVHIPGPTYREIANAIYDGEIAITIDPFIGPLAYYDVDKGVLKVRRGLNPNINERSIIVHEATHIACDWQGRSMNGLFSEMVAFVAEALYVLKMTGGKKVIGNYAADKVYEKAHQVASDIFYGRPLSTDLLADMGLNIRAVEHYGEYAQKPTPYNGR